MADLCWLQVGMTGFSVCLVFIEEVKVEGGKLTRLFTGNKKDLLVICYILVYICEKYISLWEAGATEAALYL